MQAGDHSYRRKGARLRTGTKKKGCTAAIMLRQIVLFPEYKVGLLHAVLLLTSHAISNSVINLGDSIALNTTLYARVWQIARLYGLRSAADACGRNTSIPVHTYFKDCMF